MPRNYLPEDRTRGEQKWWLEILTPGCKRSWVWETASSTSGRAVSYLGLEVRKQICQSLSPKIWNSLLKFIWAFDSAQQIITYYCVRRVLWYIVRSLFHVSRIQKPWFTGCEMLLRTPYDSVSQSGGSRKVFEMWFFNYINIKNSKNGKVKKLNKIRKW
jgi:hypothetical protein